MKSAHANSGFMLVEALIYIGVLSVVLTLCILTLNRGHQSARDLRRNAADIERTLKAGERWREDVRAAVEAPTVSEDGRVVAIRQANATVRYEFSDGRVWREQDKSRRVTLDRVQGSQFLLDKRTHVTALRWEIELATAQRVVRVRPLFTCAAVSGGTP